MTWILISSIRVSQTSGIFLPWCLDKFFIAVFIVALCYPMSSIADVLESIADQSYGEYVSCVKRTRDPSKCLDDYVKYVKAANDVLRVGRNESESARIAKSVEFLESSGEKLLLAAKEKGDAEIAGRAARIYELLAKLKKSKAGEYQELIRQANVYTNSQDLALKVAAWLQKFNADLESDKDPSEEHMAYVNNLSETYDILPERLKLDVQASLSKLDSWMDRYLAETSEQPEHLQPETLSKRVFFYRSSEKIPNSIPSREHQISQVEATVIDHLNARTAEVIAVLKEKEEVWRTSFQKQGIIAPRSIVSDPNELVSARAKADNTIRIIKSSQNHFPTISLGYSGDINTLEDRNRWRTAAEVLNFLEMLHQENLEGTLIAYQSFSPLSFELQGQQKTRSFVEYALNLLLKSQVELALSKSAFEAASSLQAVDLFAHQSFLDPVIVSSWSDVLADLAKDESRLSGLDTVVSMYADLRARHRSDPNVEKLFSRIVEVAEFAISEDGIEDVYAFGGLKLVMNTLDGLPSALKRVDPRAAMEISEARYKELLSSSLAEAKLVAKFYEALTTEITDDEVEDYIDALYELADWAKKTNSGKANEGTFLFNVTAKSYEGKVEAALPISEDVLANRYPVETVSVCVLNAIAENVVSYDDLYNAVEGFDDYHPITVSLNSELFSMLAPFQLMIEMAKMAGSGFFERSPGSNY